MGKALKGGGVFALCAMVSLATTWIQSPARAETEISTNGLMVADFESGGAVNVWTHNARATTAVAEFAGHRAAALTITQNDGRGDDGWSGAGLVVNLGNGLDLTSYTTLRFDVAVSPGSHLGQTKIKLESAGASAFPERLIRKYAMAPTTNWTTVSIPLADFKCTLTDPVWWQDLDRSQVVHLVTVSVHDQSLDNGEGTLAIDNVMFLK